MKRLALLLSVAPLALASAAQAQTATPDQNSDSTAAAPAAAAQSDAATTDGGSTDGEIIVTGLRQSLANAASIKRNSDAILDAVVAQDIGKLPDDTAAESLARLAGVQVNRYGDEVSGVLIRGLPDVATTYNGREFFTAELRRSQLQDFPAQALAGIEIYKSGTADIIEPGLAGLVNVRTRRPFDFKGLVVAGGLRGTYNDQSRKYDPSGNILISDRWNTGIGEVGLLVNASYAQSQYHNAIRYNNTSITDSSPASIITPAQTGTIRYPYSVGLYNPAGKRWRPSANFALQWAPNSSTQVYLEGIYQGYRGQGYVDDWDNDLRGQDPTLSDVVLVNGTNDVRSLTKTGGYRQQAYRSTDRAQTNTYQIASGAKWETGRATLSTDFAYTTSVYSDYTHSLDSALTSPQVVKADFISDGGVAFSLPGFNVTDPSQYIWRGYYEAYYRTSGSGFQWRGDVSLDTDPLPFLKKIQMGYRLTTRLADYASANRYAYTENLRIPFSSLGIGQLGLTGNPFRGSDQGFTQYLSYPYGDIDGGQARLRALSRQALAQLVALNPNDQGYKNAQTQFASDAVPVDPSGTFHANEKTYTAYAQGKYGFNIGSIEVDGLAGVRAVITDGVYSGVSQIYNNGVRTLTPQSLHQDYVDILPNASMRMKFTDTLQLRLGYTFTRTKPDFGQLNPALNITTVVRNANQPLDPNNPFNVITANGSGGNPNLKPLTSHNYDASLEWYFSKTGMISGAVFYRDLFGFISNYTRFVQDPQYGFVQLSRPENAGEGRILGAEANFQSFLDFLPGDLKGFGVQGNVTYLDGTNRTPNFSQNSNSFTYGPFVPITGLSKWTYNASLFYERNGITSRLSYNRRSDFVNYYGTDINNKQTVNGTLPISRLDFSLSYDIAKQFTLSVDATNLLAKPFRDFTTDNYGFRYTQDIRDEGRYYGVGFRFRFGE